MTPAGQGTLFASWEALAQLSPGARLVRGETAVASVFPHWAPLNNAVAIGAPDPAEAATVFTAAGVAEWAFWVSSPATAFAAPDTVSRVAGCKRDTTTLIMTAELRPCLRVHDGIVRTSIASATRAGDEPVPVDELGEPDGVPGLAGWVHVVDGRAVAGAWSHRHGSDCGVYAVGTHPAWRRRGIGSALVEHVLAEARRAGARTASLQSTPMGLSLYTALGFTAVGRYEEWIAS
ncbi:GNAT family N-acetyltransferase [Pseudonocardia sp. CA-107938]|uniref:GNAT family N-acetyltransferase n=1 Tax=Pseudonocardia sp. CA-107938 TaxID=3240021 RepID=UPI003D8DB05D